MSIFQKVTLKNLKEKELGNDEANEMDIDFLKVYKQNKNDGR